MALFHKVLASIGIGNAKVDTKLEKASYTAGEIMSGVVEVTGGTVEQQIDSIYLSVMTTYTREMDDKKVTDQTAVFKRKLNEPFTIGADEKREFQFDLELPHETPVTLGKTRIWVETGLDIKQAVDPGDTDYIEVRATPIAEAVLNTVRSLGFRLREVECQQASRLVRGKYPFVQEFEFVPVSGSYKGKLDELEVTFLTQSKDEVTILLQVDKKARGLGGLLSEAMGTDEKNVRLRVNKVDLPTLESKLNRSISQFS
ncbi:sporulation protein [Domibacillus epiphyticus]|uniref:Sporulation protein SpoOM n=1 Tax=Domibacillus epiphyticus TaxID=1714355 RepID=A0A1V2A3V1_9BACI|nr:sporulation protein [Domibacillus epiphyticus]OMP65683.1 sporulation protein SpoOM [Domibacillus epiphyticus]